MIDADLQRQWGLDRDFHQSTSFPEIENPSIILATDFEGPIVLGDPVAHLMETRIPQGLRIYHDIYDAFTTDRQSGRHNLQLAPDAQDIIFAIAFFIAGGVTGSDLKEAAKQSAYTPGSREMIDFINSSGGFAVGITSAPESIYEEQARDAGLARLIGSPYPIDQIRGLLEETGRFESEVDLVRRFMKEYAALRATDAPLSDSLRERIRTLLEEDFGSSYDPQVRSLRNGNGHKTVLGHLIESNSVVGDWQKKVISQEIFDRNATPDTVTVTMGDGENDRLMLAANSVRGGRNYSIAINGPEATLDAKLGVTTPNVSVLIPVLEFMLKEPEASTLDVLRHANSSLSGSQIADKVIFHLGGASTPRVLVDEHSKMKHRLRHQVKF